MCRLRADSLTEAQVKLEMGQHHGERQHIARESEVLLLAAQSQSRGQVGGKACFILNAGNWRAGR